MVKFQRNSIGRAARLAQMGAGLAGSYLAYQLQRPLADKSESNDRRQTFRRDSAKKLREGLQDLRGPMMKLGQALSMQTHMLDPVVIEELSSLQMQAPPMHPTLMRARFKNALGKYDRTRERIDGIAEKVKSIFNEDQLTALSGRFASRGN